LQDLKALIDVNLQKLADDHAETLALRQRHQAEVSRLTAKALKLEGAMEALDTLHGASVNPKEDQEPVAVSTDEGHNRSDEGAETTRLDEGAVGEAGQDSAGSEA
jgi:hypothetical protein